MGPLFERLAEIDRTNRWIIASDVAAAATGLVQRMRDNGADQIMVVSAVEGVGDLPEGVPIVYNGVRGSTVMKGIRAYLDSIAEPSTEIVESVDDFDPDREALVIAPAFYSADTALGRRAYGARRREWALLEDKTLAAGLWDEAGLRTAPSEVVPVASAARAAESLAGEQGTVWAADNTDGWHGGADYLRWVSTADDAFAATAWLSRRARRVRVMPFLEGIPCSIHSFVTVGRVAAFRPVELVVLRDEEGRRLVYGGVATFWDPPIAIREYMRSAARSVGHVMAERVGYLGPFSLDGICTGSGFMPTEVNPRLSVGIGVQARAAGFPLGSFTRALIAGDVTVDAGQLEPVILPAADGSRSGGMGLPVPVRRERESCSVVFGRSGVEDVDGDGDASIEIGPTASGTYVRMKLDPEQIIPGPSVAPLAARAAAFANERWGLGLANLTPANDPFG